MSPPTHFFSGSGAGKPPPEKSKFLQTCNRLSLFLKENSKIRDLNFGINPKFNATTGVLETSLPGEGRTIDLLSTIDDVPPPPEYVILDSSSIEVENSTNKAAGSSKPKTTTAQMTIFYGGQVLVLDDVPADRARDLILMAKNGVETSKQPPPPPTVDVSRSKEKEAAEVQQQAKDSDLPIARRASLHKFLAKRKDRAIVRAAPYQQHNHSPGGSSSGNDHTFDLNCNP